MPVAAGRRISISCSILAFASLLPVRATGRLKRCAAACRLVLTRPAHHVWSPDLPTVGLTCCSFTRRDLETGRDTNANGLSLCLQPQHGRSSGLHCFIKDESALPLALDAVMRDVIRLDLASGRPKRKVALVGHSLGGWTMCVACVLS